MRSLLVIIAMSALCGCSIQKINRPPMGSAIITHERFFGLNASIPVGGGETVGVKLGWGSAVWSVIPCSTNAMYAAPVSDTFSLGQGLSPFSTRIDEDLQAGWSGAPPAPRLMLFSPKAKP